MLSSRTCWCPQITPSLRCPSLPCRARLPLRIWTSTPPVPPPPPQSETALEDLDQYPEEPEVHKYLHKRLMAFDLSTLYELHYLMITLGKASHGECRRREGEWEGCS